MGRHLSGLRIRAPGGSCVPARRADVSCLMTAEAQRPHTPPMAIRYRPAVPTDTRAMFDVCHDSFADLDRRIGSPDAVDPAD